MRSAGCRGLARIIRMVRKVDRDVCGGDEGLDGGRQAERGRQGEELAGGGYEHS